ncbi:MAG: hypothetical protein ACOYJV_08635 [Aminivibrio sp.]
MKEVAVCQHDGVLHAVIHPDPDKVIEIITGSAEEYFRKEVIGPYNRQASSSKRIIKFTVVNQELPKTRIGKIRRFQLPELIAETPFHRPEG